MLFPKDTFTKHLEQLLQIISEAESLIDQAERREDIKISDQANKALENASKRLKGLYSEILAHTETWDETTIKKRKSEYDHLVTRYKSAQQRAESLNSNPDSEQRYIP